MWGRIQAQTGTGELNSYLIAQVDGLEHCVYLVIAIGPAP